MKRAHTHREYRNVHGFEPPQGVVSAEVDVATGKLGVGRNEVYVAGTQPVDGVSGQTQVFGWDAPEEPKAGEAARPMGSSGGDSSRSVTMRKRDMQAKADEAEAGRKPKTDAESQQNQKGIWGRIRSIFK
jgi:hypothetical protein